MSRLYTLLTLGGLLALVRLAHAQAVMLAPVANYSTGNNTRPLDLAVADVNGDGKPDVLTANGGNATGGRLLGTGTLQAAATYSAGALLGNGNGTFQAATTYPTGPSSGPASLATQRLSVQ